MKQIAMASWVLAAGALSGLGAAALLTTAGGIRLAGALFGSLLAVGLWRRAGAALGDARLGALVLLGLWPLVAALPPAFSRGSLEPVLLGVTLGAALAGVALFWRALARPLPLGRPRLSLAIVLGAYIALSFGWACQVHASYGFWGRDEAVFAQSIWSAARGEFFRNSIEGPWVSHFAIHNSPVMLLWLPFYLIVPRFETIMLLNCVLVGASVIPIYRIARLALPAGTSVLLGLAYLAHPFVGGTTTLSVTEAAWTYLPLGVALWGVVARRTGLLLCGALGALLVQEYLGVVLLAVAALALARRMTWSGIGVAVVGLLWVALSLKIVFPFFGSESLATTGFDCRFGHLGSTPEEALRALAADPLGIGARQLLRRREWAYYGLAPVLGVLPFASLIGLAGLVPFFTVAIQDSALSPLKFCAWPVFLYAAVAVGLPRVAGFLARRTGGARGSEAGIAFGLAAVLLASSVAAYRGWAFYRGPQLSPERLAVYREAVALIPPDAALSAPDNLLPALAERREIAIVWWERATDWILSERQSSREGYGPQAVNEALLVREGPYERVFERDGIEVWRRLATPEPAP